MTDLSKLSVSLTKHGAHKVADLLKKVDVAAVLSNTWGSVPGVNIDTAQAKKTLSAASDGTLPLLWVDAKGAGSNHINALVLLGIIFSHHTLIEVMANACTGPGVGTIARGDLDGGKAFTNLKDDFKELGFSLSDSPAQFTFDFRELLTDGDVGQLVLKLMQTKLAVAGWDGLGNPAEECVAVGFHRALGLGESQFREWVATGGIDLEEIVEVPDPEVTPSGDFTFRVGHKKRKAGEVTKEGHGGTSTARLIHNELQEKLYAWLSAKYGERNVGTEIASGLSGTMVDAVVTTKKGHIFFEIKTSVSLRKCIREALSQIMEYAYWPGAERALKLVIVSRNKSTQDAKQYLAHLRDKFGVPVYHETINASSGALSDRI